MAIANVTAEWVNGVLTFKDTSGTTLVAIGPTGITLGTAELSISSTATTIEAAGLVLENLPTSDPGEAGQVYSDTNVLTVSAGT